MNVLVDLSNTLRILNAKFVFGFVTDAEYSVFDSMIACFITGMTSKLSLFQILISLSESSIFTSIEINYQFLDIV